MRRGVKRKLKRIGTIVFAILIVVSLYLVLSNIFSDSINETLKAPLDVRRTGGGGGGGGGDESPPAEE
jgi:hypothetical protein